MKTVKHNIFVPALSAFMVMGMTLTAVPAHAALITQGTSIMRITVNQVFSLKLGTFAGGTGPTAFNFTELTANTILTFPAADPGRFVGNLPSVEARANSGDAPAQSGLIMKVSTNNGQVWRLQVSENQPLTRDGGGFTIADANFRYFTWMVSGEATQVGLTTLPILNDPSDPSKGRYNTMSTTPFTIYTAQTNSSTNLPGNETLDTDTRVHMQFGVLLPAVLPGTYRNNVIITLTE